MFRRVASRLAVVSLGGAAVAVGVHFAHDRLRTKQIAADASAAGCGFDADKNKIVAPSRDSQIKRLKDEEFDVLVIGGGASGTGVALDAQTRGLSTALVEMQDFAAGTSSRSTKLIHGGVRYLEKAVMNLDLEQLALVYDALHERQHVLTVAPHLSAPLDLVCPVYGPWYSTVWRLPYFYVGMKCYDALAGRRALRWSHFLTAKETLESLPTLREEHLAGAVQYTDGQQNDARVNVALAMTAAAHGAAVANHVKVVRLLAEESGRVCGAVVEDTVTGEQWPVRAKTVVNATGPFADRVRGLTADVPSERIVPAAGAHVTLPASVCPSSRGMLIPETSDGRVVFMLPWEGAVIAGTTDRPVPVSENPAATQEEVDFILRELSKYLRKDVPLSRQDVLSAWSGIRPLVKAENAENTAALSRDHVVEVLPKSGLISLMGGKWTTYRKMAEDAVDMVITVGADKGVKAKRQCVTTGTPLIGAHALEHTKQSAEVAALDSDVREHLLHNYGDRAVEVLGGSKPERLVEGQPFLRQEVRYACEREMAASAVDVVARRTRLAFLDTEAAKKASADVIDIMAQQLAWTPEQRMQQQKEVDAYLASCSAQ